MAGKQGHVGHPKSYQSKEELEAAVNAYFATISYTAPVTTYVPVEQMQNGRQKLEERPVLGADGKPMQRTAWISPPNRASLCLHLRISEDTWENYATDRETYPGYWEVCEQAKLRMQAYNVEELLKREKGTVQGLIFSLKNNYGWKDSKEVELGEETRKTVSLDHMTMAQKMAYIRQAAADIGADDGDADSD